MKSTDNIPEEIMARAEKLSHIAGLSDVSGKREIARALMEAEARGEARGMEKAAKVADEFCEKNEEYLRNAPSLRFQSGPHTDAEKRRREAMAKHAWAYRNVAAAIRAGGKT